MKYNDYELIMLYRERDEIAESILIKKYRQVINYNISSKYNLIKNLNINIDNLKDECLKEVYKGLESFSLMQNTSLNYYLSFIIQRKIKKVIHYYLKHPLDYEENIDGKLYEESTKTTDPLSAMIKKEQNYLVNHIILSKLNSFELQVLILLLNNESYTDIACAMNKSYNQIKNAIAKIRRKVRPDVKKILQNS